MTVARRPVAFFLVALFAMSSTLAVGADEGHDTAPSPPVEVLPDHVAQYVPAAGTGPGHNGPTPITSSSMPSGIDVRVGRDHAGAGDLLVSEDWLRSRVQDFATTRAYSEVTMDGAPWIRVPLDADRGAQAVSFTTFVAEVDEKQFGRGSGDSIWLTDRPMSITILEVPGEREVAFEDENGTTTESVRTQRLAIDFNDGDSTGQTLEYDQAWLAGFGFEEPVFRSSDGEAIPAKLVDGTYVVFAPHFSIVYTFNNDEGFTREADRTYSHVYWSSADSAVILQQDKRDSQDEILSKPLPVSLTTSVGGEVQAVHTVTTQGNHQSHIPLFITKAGNTDINTGESSAYYYLQGRASTDTSRLYMRIRDASGTLAYENYISAPSNVERELSIEYQPPNTFYFRVADRDGGYVTSYQAIISSYSGLQFDKWGFASNGWSGAQDSIQYAKIDDAVLRYGSQDANPPCLDTTADGGGYRCSKVSYAPVSMSGSTQLTLADDAVSSSISLPFSFPFYGSSYSQVKVSSNGFLSFDGGTDNGCCTGDNLPTTNTPNAVVACGWEDLDPTRSISGFNPPKIHYRSVGSPATKWVVEYDNIYSYQTNPTYLGTGNKFQIHLESDGDIYCMLEDIVDDTDTLPTTIGIENAAGTQGTRYLYGEAGIRNVGVLFRKDITNGVPEAPSDPSPIDGAERQLTSLTLSWTGHPDPDGDPVTYHVYLREGTSGPYNAPVCSKTDETWCAVSGLTRGLIYNWYVVADDNNDGIDTVSSQVWQFSVNRLPTTPYNPSPVDGSTVAPPTRLDWSGSDPDFGDTVTYQVKFEAGDSSPDPTLSCDNSNQASYCYFPTGTNLVRGSHYYWQVISKDLAGEESPGPVWDFWINRLPTACFSIMSVDDRTVHVNSSCSDDAEDGDPNLQFEWIWGDGTSTTSHGDTTVSHRYDACPLPNPTISLWVRDSAGEWSATSATDSPTLTEEDQDADGLGWCNENSQGTSDTDADFDDDGINDYVESSWHPHRNAIFCGNSACAYPNPTSPDIYVEVDWMTIPASGCVLGVCAEPAYSTKPTATHLNPVVQAFSAQGINVHFDTGQLGGGNEVVHNDVIRDSTSSTIDFYDYKRGGNGITSQFDVRTPDNGGRYGVFHYMLAGDRYYYPAEPDSSGFAYYNDDDLFISVGAIHDGFYNSLDSSDFDLAYSGTIIHELGHNLCLSGDDSITTGDCFHRYIDADGPPEYKSSMSYTYQFQMVDYSHGNDPATNSGGQIDHDDWRAITLAGVNPSTGDNNLGASVDGGMDGLRAIGVAAPVPLEAPLE